MCDYSAQKSASMRLEILNDRRLFPNQITYIYSQQPYNDTSGAGIEQRLT